MRAYINGASAISPQPTFDEAAYLQELVKPEKEYFQALEPEYRQYIDPKLSRRMARIIKMSVAAAMKSLQQAGITQPEAITIGTGLGCLQDTEKFLTEMVETSEGLLSPTAFIQSTHNTIAGQIALLLGCSAHNFTFVQRAFSFERALEDALLQIHEGVQQILLGGVDEVTPNLYKILQQAGCIDDAATLSANDSSKHKPAWGEGASFFLLSATETAGSLARLDGLKTFYQPEGPAEIIQQLRTLLAANHIDAEAIDALMLGYNGHERDNAPYDLVRRELFPQQPVLCFKHLCGEYFTASAFGLHLAARSLQQGQEFPRSLLNGSLHKPLNKLLFYNHFQGKYHTLMLLSACRPL
ncbi:MAG: beta-ketoacyl synthase chain length factor [Bacteroidetes bacterium]|nr:beta-ketoacyl synthase chain length factor [Bacteroidota bacterium]